MNKQVCRIILALAVTCMAATQPARGGLLTPNGNPTGPASSTSPTQPDGYRYIVSLNPTQAFINDALTAPSPLTLALNAQGYTAANGWNITYRDLAGDVRLDTYYAWTENRPAVAEGTLLVAGAAVPGYGGAAIAMHYLPQAGDPTGAGLHWLQVIYTNAPLGNAVGYQSGNFTTYLDDAGNTAGAPGTTGPWYDTVPYAAANTTDFIDEPSRKYSDSTVWQATTYLSTGDTATHTLTIWRNGGDGVTWGFDDPFVPTPEPSSFLLLGTAGALGLFCRFGKNFPRLGVK